uniref:UPF0565 protein C2orf69 n=2 Tax=Macrostomum lignano TaxID=282301 RepID=A0A1I8IQG1_9PLAT
FDFQARKVSQQAACYRLSQVAGYAGCRNDLIYACHPSSRQAGCPDQLIVYFGGDVQDYVECMDSHGDNCKYRQWNLEATARLLLTRFGRNNSEVFVVRPKRMESGTYSVYSNFVDKWSETDGAPVFDHPYRPDGGGRAVRHLAELLARARRELSARQAGDEDEEEAEQSDSVRVKDEASVSNKVQGLILIGFSKGCVPLNQLVRELSHDKSSGLLPGLSAIYWLDGGHAGRSDTWLTDPSDLTSLTNLRVRAYATPYQVRDSNRPWIGREFESFLAGCSAPPVACTDLRSGVLCQESAASLDAHFRLLEVFPVD